MKRFIPTLLLLLLITPAFAHATPINLDFAAGVLQPLQVAWSALFKADHFVATGTAASVFPNASTTVTSATTLCLSNDCRTVWPSAGSGTGLATTAPWTLNQVVVVLDNGHVTSIATSSLGLLTTNVAEGSNLYYTTARGLADFITNLAATTSVKSITALPSLSLPYSQLTGTPTITTYTGTYPIIVSGSVISTALASSSLTASSPLTGSFAQVGTGGSLGCQTASGSQAGCLSAADWTTFNNKGAGTVTAVSVASANGFAGSSSGGSTPALTLSTSISGVLKGNGTAISAAANGTDYTLITANSCSAGQHVSAVTAAGVITCSPDTGSGGTGLATTTPIAGGNVLAYTASGAGFAYGVATSAPTLSSELTYGGTLGSFVGGVGGAFSLTTNGTALSKLVQIGANTILGNNTGSTGNVVAIATSSLYGLGTNGFVLAEVGGVPTWVATTTLSTISGTLSLTTQAAGTLQAAQFPALTGDITTSAGSLATALKSTGTAGTYRSTTFDAQGRETSGTNPTTFAGYAISDSSANLASALTDETGSGLAVFNAAPTFTGLATFANSSTSIASFTYASSTSGYFGTLNIPNLGTAAGAFLAVDPTGKVIATTTPSGGSGVTSVAQTVPAFLSISGSPITTTGTLAISLSGFALPFANGGTGTTTNRYGGVFFGDGTVMRQASTSGLFDYDPTTQITTAKWASTTAASGVNSNWSGILVAARAIISGITGAFTPSVEGEVGIDTTANQFKFFSNGAVRVLMPEQSRSFTYATGTWTGTTTIPLDSVINGYTFTKGSCFTDAGTLNVQIGQGSASTTLFNASTTNGIITFSSNNSFTTQDKVKVDVGTPASSPTKIVCTAAYTFNAQ